MVGLDVFELTFLANSRGHILLLRSSYAGFYGSGLFATFAGSALGLIAVCAALLPKPPMVGEDAIGEG